MRNLLYLALPLFLFSCSNSTQEEFLFTPEQIVKSSPERDSLHQALDSLHKIGIFNGFSVAIVNESGTIFNKGYGYADKEIQSPFTENTLINIASISKMFIGVSLMKSIELGFLKLDDPINKHLPFKVVNPHFPNQDILIRHLATHTSSIRDNHEYMKSAYVNKDDVPLKDSLIEKYELYYANSSSHSMSLSAFLQKLTSKEGEWYNKSAFDKNSAPGELYEYSNIGASLCALIIENASKTPFHKFTKKHIFKPLKMNSTGWFFEDIDLSKHSKLYYDQWELPYYRSLSYPDGALITSSTDLSKFLHELMLGYQQKGKLLSASSYREMFKPQLEGKHFNDDKNFSVGYFTERYDDHYVIGHSGGDPGTNTMLFFNTKNNFGRIMLLNSDSKKENSMEVYWGIWNALENFQEKI